MPVSDSVADVIVSNCVLNLVPDKQKVIAEIHRVLKPGGHFSISDIVLEGNLPDALREDAEMYAGCVAGAIQKSDYLKLIADAGLTNVTIQKEKPIDIPLDILSKYLSQEEAHSFNKKSTGIFSITVYAEKQGQADEKPIVEKAEVRDSNCCAPTGECC